MRQRIQSRLHGLTVAYPCSGRGTTDGDRGALAAIKACWPTSRLQRCLVHIQRNIRTLTTTRPKTDQHKALYKLALDLT
ncbi:MAG: transposase, partial [Trueperella sp.]